MQRWSLIFVAYTYDLDFRRTAEHGNADTLSLLVPAEELYHLEFFESSVTVDGIREFTETKKDPILGTVVNRLFRTKIPVLILFLFIESVLNCLWKIVSYFGIVE